MRTAFNATPASKRPPGRRFPLERRPLFTALFAGNSVAELVRSARAAHWQGADAVCAELRDLPREERTAEALRPFMTATPLPTMCCLYRNDSLGQDDDARQKDLLAALEAGAACIDVMGDLYDPSPREWTRKPAAVAKQRRLITKIHEAGAQVIVSAHLYAFVGPDEVLAQLKDFEKRGADIVKLVQTADTEEEFLAALRATLLCRRELKAPFVHLVSGAFAALHRLIAPSLGLALTFAKLDPRDAIPMPPLSNLKGVFENLKFQLP
ncbi:MAG: type I 3-dehydroquinate dehydratase [Kiritimatiellae bacterium]|nr:type I 3-dehydroquinate dehydratase [Kiritimatiellia bacterium]